MNFNSAETSIAFFIKKFKHIIKIKKNRFSNFIHVFKKINNEITQQFFLQS